MGTRNANVRIRPLVWELAGWGEVREFEGFRGILVNPEPGRALPSSGSESVGVRLFWGRVYVTIHVTNAYTALRYTAE